MCTTPSRRAEDWVRCSPAYTVQLDIWDLQWSFWNACLSLAWRDWVCCFCLLAVGTFWNTSLISGPKYPGESYARAFHSKSVFTFPEQCAQALWVGWSTWTQYRHTRVQTLTQNSLHMAQMPNKWLTLLSPKLTWSISEFINAQSHTMTAGPGKVCSQPCYTQTVSPTD